MATIKFKRGTTDPITIAPAGLTMGEPVFNTALNKFFVHNGTTGIWVGGEIDNNTALGTSQVKIPTQYAVKTYVDNNIASGFVTSVNGVTGAASLRAGTAISIVAGTDPDKGITITNIGVQSLALTATSNGGLIVNGAGTTGALSKDIAISFANLPSLGASVATGDLLVVGDVSDSDNTKDTTVGNVLDIINGDVNVDSSGTSSIGTGVIVNTDISDSAAIAVTKLSAYTISGHTLGNNLSTLTIGTGLGGSSYNGTAPITISNIGVLSLAGTANEIEVVTAATGAVQIGLPNDVTIGGNLSVVGNLTVNGTTTTVNSTTVAIQDPIFTLGGTAALGADDNKDRGIEFRWYSGSAKTGFFGFDDSIGRLTFIPDATNTSEVFSGTGGDAQLASLYLVNGSNTGQLTPTTLDGDRVYTLPNHSGSVVVPTNLGTSTYILQANGVAAQPTWVDPTTFTTGIATTVTLVATNTTAATHYLTFVDTATGNENVRTDTDLIWNPSTNTMTLAAGAGYIEAIVDGGAY